MNAAVALATYVKTSGTVLGITYDTFADEGNAFTLTASADTVSAATLEGGETDDELEMAAETMALVTVAGTAMDFVLPLGAEGEEKCLYLKSKGTGANAVVNGVFAGGTTITFDTAGELAKIKFLGSSWAVIANTGALS